MKPTLTRPRWRALKTLEPLGDKPFIGSQIGIKGPTLISLERCGWVARVDAPDDETPFAVWTQGNHWQVTEAGKTAISHLPETQPRRT